MCWLNVSNGSNVTTRIFGFLHVGMLVLSIDKFNSVVTTFFHRMKSAAEDLYPETVFFQPVKILVEYNDDNVLYCLLFSCIVQLSAHVIRCF